MKLSVGELWYEKYVENPCSLVIVLEDDDIPEPSCGRMGNYQTYEVNLDEEDMDLREDAGVSVGTLGHNDQRIYP